MDNQNLPPTPVPPVPPKPVIYSNSKPNFIPEPPLNPKQRFIKRLIELDIGLHIFVGVLAIIFIIALVVNAFHGALLKPSVPKVAETQGTIVKVAEAADKSPIFINDQVMSIDKAFNAEPTQIKLTINGQLKKEVFGFLPNWVVDDADQIDTRLLTSVSYFGLEIGADGNIVKSSPDSEVSDAWTKWQQDPNLINFLRKLKSQRIKTFLTLKSFSNDNIERLVRSDQAQQTFINNALYQMNAKSLDGINIDFEYTGQPPDDVKDKFSIMMSNLNTALKRQYPKSVLSIDTYAQSAVTSDLFDIELLSKNCDYLVMMGYDFHTPQSDTTGAIAPLGGNSLNILDMVDAYLEKIPPEKLVLAVPYYGYDWPTTTATENATVVPGGDIKVLSYAEIADMSQKININWDNESQTPWYSYVDPDTKQIRVVHFENTRSLGIKYDLINKKGLQGVGIWALGLDGRSTELEQLLADKFAN